MPVPVECEQCQAKYLIDDKFAGKKARCKRCGVVMSIPLPPAMHGGGDAVRAADAEDDLAARSAAGDDDGGGSIDVAAPAPGAARAPGAAAPAGASAPAGAARKPPGWRIEDVVIERDEDVTDIPLRASGGKASAGGTPFGRLVPTLILVFVVAVLFLAAKEQLAVAGSAGASTKMPASIRVWATAVMRLVTFFGIVGPLTMAGFMAAARIREFRLLSPAYLRATAVAALPVTLYLVLSSLAADGLSNTLVFLVLVLAVAGLTFQAIRVIFYLEPPASAVSGACALLAGVVGMFAAVWLTATFISFVPEPPGPQAAAGGTTTTSGSGEPTLTQQEEPGVNGYPPGGPTTGPVQPTGPGDPTQGDGPGGPVAQTRPTTRVVASGPPPGVAVGPPPGVEPPSPTEGGATTTRPATSRPATTRPRGKRRVTIFGDDDAAGPVGDGFDPAVEFAARIREAGGPAVRKVVGVPLPAGARPVLGTLAPSRTFAIVERRTLNEEQVDVWTGDPPKKALGNTFKVGPQFNANYAIATDASRVARVVAFPRLQARVWLADEQRETAAMDLDGDFGVPHLLGFLGAKNDRFLVRWEKGGQHGLEVWDVRTAKSLRRVELPDHEATSANEAVSPDGVHFAHAARSRQANQLLLHNLTKNAPPRRIPITALDERWSIRPAGIAFSPDGSKVAALFVHEGDALVVAYHVNSGKPAGEVIVPATVSALRWPEGEEPARSLDWVAGGRAWLICGTVVVDATSGSLLADLDASGVVAQAVGEGNVVRLAFARRDKPGAVVTFEIDPAKLRPPKAGAKPAQPKPAKAAPAAK